MIRMVCIMSTNLANSEEFNSSVNAGLLFLSHGKGQKSITSPWFKDNLPLFLNTVRALTSVAHEGGNVHTLNGDQYHVSEYSLGAGFRKLVEFSKVYLNLNGRHVSTPILEITAKPDEKLGILTPSQVDAFNAYLRNVDGLNFSATKVDVMGTHLFAEVNVLKCGDSMIQVGVHSSLDDVIFAEVAGFSCGVDFTNFGVPAYDQLSDVQLVQWLFGFSSGSSVGGKENVETN